MSPTPDMTTILDELSAGRIDAAEAARRIDALKTAEPAKEPSVEPTNEELSERSGQVADDAWAAATDRPQQATVTSETFRTAEPAPEYEATPEQMTTPEQSATPQQQPTEPEKTDQPERTKPVHTGGVDRISVRAVGRRVRIIGETSVATVSADGPHVLRRNGSVLEISSDGEIGSSLDGFSILKAPRNLDDIRSLGLGKELFLRINPSIIVDVELTAGSLNTERVPHLGKIRVTAGGAKLLDVQQINDALIQAGQATIKGTITTGRSRVRAESGSLNIQLTDDSNVTIKGDAQLGKIAWSGGHSGAGDEVVMGNGNARLDVEVVMGHAQVKVGTDHTADADVS